MRLLRTLGRLAAVALLALALSACDGDDGATGTATTTRDDSAQVMAAAIHRLISRDHTFGQGAHRFTEYLIQDHTDPGAGAPVEPGTPPARPLTAAERAAIEAVVAPFGPHRVIGDAAEWRTKGDVGPRIEGSVILGVGEPAIDGDTALVPVSLWCGNLCGNSLSYRIDRTGDRWRVVGTEGPQVIS